MSVKYRKQCPYTHGLLHINTSMHKQHFRKVGQVHAVADYAPLPTIPYTLPYSYNLANTDYRIDLLQKGVQEMLV